MPVSKPPRPLSYVRLNALPADTSVVDRDGDVWTRRQDGWWHSRRHGWTASSTLLHARVQGHRPLYRVDPQHLTLYTLHEAAAGMWAVDRHGQMWLATEETTDGYGRRWQCITAVPGTIEEPGDISDPQNLHRGCGDLWRVVP